MKIFNFFKSKSPESKDIDGQLVDQVRSRRNHQRYYIVTNEFLYCEDDSGNRYNILDLSFKGTLIEPQIYSGVMDITVLDNMTLVVFGQRLKVPMSQVQRRDQGWALVFNHESDEVVFGLSKILEPLRLGSTCVQIPIEFTKDLPGSLRKRFSGDGPLDIVVERNTENRIHFAMITVRRGATYWSLLWEDGAVITKKSVDGTGVGARMAQTSEIDLELVTFAAICCLGMKFPEGNEITRYLGAWLLKHSP